MKYIIDYITVFVDWIINLFESLFSLIYNLLLIIIECGEFLVSIISSLPKFLSIGCVALVAVCIIYKILGREGGEAN